MIKIIQIGEGNFLRTFVDAYFDSLNKEGAGEYSVDIVKPIPYGNLDRFAKQNNKYHIVLRGVSNGKDVEDVYKIDVIDKVIDPFIDQTAFYSLAKDPDTKILVSNTTEAGIRFNPKDDIDDFEDITYPAKLTKWLYERYKNKLPGIYLLPVELIDNNADELLRSVNSYIDLWGLGEDFKKWNEKSNYYCNTLVDRIVSGFPKDQRTKEHLWNLIGEEDELVSIGEPFGLWAIEDKGNIRELIKDGHHNIDVVLTNDIAYYKKRKVRVLNGSHTNLVPAALWLGKETVYDAMDGGILTHFIDATLDNEIVPFVSSDVSATRKFASDVRARFRNPFLNHQLTSIALNSVSKWKARCLPSYLDYYHKNEELPPLLSIGLAYLVTMYRHIEKCGDKYVCHLPSRDIEVKDDERYLNYFLAGKTIKDFLSDIDAWGMDLTTIEGLFDKIITLVKMIEEGKEVI